jgi:hypothetical protein
VHRYIALPWAAADDVIRLQIVQECKRAGLEAAASQLGLQVVERTARLRATVAALEHEIEACRNMELELRRYSRQLVSLQEEERAHFARELHDWTCCASPCGAALSSSSRSLRGGGAASTLTSFDRQHYSQ